MATFTLQIPNYERYLQELTVPIVEDRRFPLQSQPLRDAILRDSTLHFSIDETVVAAERFLSVSGESQLPARITNNWRNSLRAEVATFWNVDSMDQTFWRADMLATGEHGTRAGEYVAYGVSVLLFEKLLGIGRQNVFFYKGGGARPDFVVEMIARRNQRYGVPVNGVRIGLESRWRASQASLHRRDIKDLQAKKQSAASHHFQAFVSVYTFYGEGLHDNSQPKTRIHIADPKGDGEPILKDERLTILAYHYMNVASRIGLWDIYDQLAGLLAPEVEVGGGNSRPAAWRVKVKSEKRGDYIGIRYETDDAQIFHGVNQKVIQLLLDRSVEEASTFFDEPSQKYSIYDGFSYRYVSPDGVMILDETK